MGAQGRPRILNAAGRSSQRFSVSAARPSRGFGGASIDIGLPLRVFPVPLLTQVDADLIFISASRGDSVASNSSPGGAKKRTSNAGARFGVSRGSTTPAKKHLSPDTFLPALQAVALRCFPAKPEDSLENFGDKVLLPLSEVLLEVKGQDLAFAADLVTEEETVKLLERCQPGLEQIYAHYAHDHAGRRAHWSSEAITRFAEEFDILSEVGHLPLQRIFRDCTHYESLSGKGVENEMSWSSFHLALLMIAQKVHVGPNQAIQPLDRVINLFQRFNSVASCSGVSSPWKSLEAELIPGLPTSPSLLSSSAGQKRNSTQQGSSGVGRTEKRAAGKEMSWELMMQSTV